MERLDAGQALYAALPSGVPSVRCLRPGRNLGLFVSSTRNRTPSTWGAVGGWKA